MWVDGALPVALGDTGGQVVGGFNAPNRVVLTRDARPGDSFQIAVFGINGPISASPHNYIWMRTATLDFYPRERAAAVGRRRFELERLAPGLDEVAGDGARVEQVAGGFEFTEGPVWSPEGALLFSSPNTNAIYRWDPRGEVTVFRSKSGYTGTDIGRYHQPGSNGLTFDPDGRLVMCQHGNRRVLRVEPHGNIDRDGRPLPGPAAELAQRPRLPLRRHALLHRPALRAARRLRRPGQGAAVLRRLRRPRRRGDPRHRRAGRPQRPGLLARRALPLRRQLGPRPQGLMRYALDEHCAVREATVFADLTAEPGEDALDGLKVDEAGNVYACGPGGVWIIAPTGERLGLLRLPEDPHNLAWGEDDRRTLYITALTGVYRIRLDVPGVPLPRSNP